MIDPLDPLAALLDPFGPESDGQYHRVLNGTDPILRYSEDLIRVGRENGQLEFAAAVLLLARAYEHGQSREALALLLTAPGLAIQTG